MAKLCWLVGDGCSMDGGDEDVDDDGQPFIRSSSLVSQVLLDVLWVYLSRYFNLFRLHFRPV